jgi:hypothetical protein
MIRRISTFCCTCSCDSNARLFLHIHVHVNDRIGRVNDRFPSADLPRLSYAADEEPKMMMKKRRDAEALCIIVLLRFGACVC